MTTCAAYATQDEADLLAICRWATARHAACSPVLRASYEHHPARSLVRCLKRGEKQKKKQETQQKGRVLRVFLDKQGEVEETRRRKLLAL